MRKPEIKVIQTEDGSHSLYRKDLNETYHSFHGAIQESQHVFIQMGLQYFVATHPKKTHIRILEVGFGTGLNALLSLDFAVKNDLSIAFHSLETIPLREEIYTQLNYTEELGHYEYFVKMHKAPWDTEYRICDHFRLQKINRSLEKYDSSDRFDLIFFDAFAPSKQPELWELPMIEKCFHALDNPGVFVTYCAKGQLKRDLKSAGFLLDTLPGAPGKKEMVRGVKQ